MSSKTGGDFALEGGYPGRDSIGAIYDELDFQRAVQAYIWATPAVGAQAVADGLAELGLSLTTVGIFENFLDAQTVVATGNGESIYAFGAIDLEATGPVVVETPPGVLGFAMSGWQQPLEDIGPLGPDKGNGGKFLFLPPSSEEPVPDGHFAVPSDTMLFIWLVRGFVKDGKTEPAVEAIKGMRIYRLADAASPPPMEFVNVSGRKATLIPVGDQVDGLAFFETLARVVEREPTREQDKQFLGLLASIGIERGTPFAPDERRRDILTRAAATGHVMTAAISYDSRSPNKLRWPGKSRWEELLLTEHVDFVAPDHVELDPRAGLYYQAAGASKGALLDIVGAGSKYAAAFKDRDGVGLDGSRSYRLRVPPNPSVKDFWSVVVYDAETRSMIANDQGMSSRNSYQQLAANDDGSIDLYFGPKQRSAMRTSGCRPIPASGSFSTSAGTGRSSRTSTRAGRSATSRPSDDRRHLDLPGGRAGVSGGGRRG